MITKDSGGAISKTVEYTYDLYDRRIAKSIDPDGDGAAAAIEEHYVYDGEHIALVFDGEGNQLSRYLHGPQIDQVLAQETSDGEVRWALADHQSSVRDLIDSDGNVLNHITYDSYGQVTSETNPELDFRFGYTGRERDEETGLYYYRARYFDPAVGTFVSEDPLGFGAGDANVYRYVGNSPTNYSDPSGEVFQALIPVAAGLGPIGWVTLGVGVTLIVVGAAYLQNREAINTDIARICDRLTDTGWNPDFDPNNINNSNPTALLDLRDLRPFPPSDFGLADGLGGFGAGPQPDPFTNPPPNGGGLDSVRPEDFVFDINFGRHLRDIAGDPPEGMVDPHAHHILYKKGKGAKQQELVQEGQRILRGAGIDPILGPENLTWAPNRVAGQHGVDDLSELVETLRAVEAAGGDREDLAEVLQDFGERAAQRR